MDDGLTRVNTPTKMLDTEPLLGLVVPFLTLHELWSVRGVSRHCLMTLPRYTRRLVGESFDDADALARIVDYFPDARHVSLHRVTVPVERLNHVLTQFDKWKLTQLELIHVWNLTDADVRLVTEKLAGTLEKLTLRQCFRLTTPAIRGGAALKSVTVESCLVTEFHDDTTWPNLEELRLSSRVLTTMNARHLLRRQLAQSQIRTLDLSDCFMVEQLLIDPGELPQLQTLLLRSCLAMKRVHVASTSLQVLDLSLCAEMEVVVLELHSAKRLDLSYLQKLTHLFLRSDTLGLLNLRACSKLAPENLRVECPAIVAAYVDGTKLQRQDLHYTASDVAM